ncbi:MAG: ribosome biogenesis GTP-binding protein YsxC [Bdellovibrionaceae bacterium]|nr:ribosome biogenesis GTP-binding protein YsxC [Pseudobdellovibrionaceae bacterium]
MPGPIKFLKSAVLPKDYPKTGKREIAIAGRSNAGKSSFLNSLANSKVAKVSDTPGKTRLLNFFTRGDSYIIVDMPGYGFAARSGDEMRQWHTMVENYLSVREELAGLVLVMDGRREWSEDEELLKAYTESRGIPLAIVLTKSDKMSKNDILNNKTRIKKDSGTNTVFMTSALKKTGHDEVEEYLYENWVKAK